MSWLNRIKDELATLAQEVFIEPTATDEDHNVSSVSSNISSDCDVDLIKTGIDQKEEIEHVLNKNGDLNKGSISQKSRKSRDTERKLRLTELLGSVKNGTDLEESWSWELPDVPKSDKDKKPETSKKLGEKVENNTALLLLIKELEEDKRKLNQALEELDLQNSIDMQNMIDMKEKLQYELSKTKKEIEKLKEEKAESLAEYEIKMYHTNKKCDEMTETYRYALEKHEFLQDQLKITKDELENNNEEMLDIRNLLQKSEQDNKNMLERIKLKNEETEQLTAENIEMQNKMEALSKELDETKKQMQELKTSESSGSFSVKLSEDGFIVVRDGDTTSSGPTTPPTKEALKEKILQLEKRVSELTLENGSLLLKLTNEEEKVAIMVKENDDSKKKEDKIISELEEKTIQLLEENKTLRFDLDRILSHGKDIVDREVTDLDDDEFKQDKNVTINDESIRSLLKLYFEEEKLENDKTLERTYCCLNERLQKFDGMKRRIKEVTEELDELRMSKLVWEHEKKTLEADISQYILQCDELMKNNEILLNELENYKSTKLETIPEERTEENVLQLEAQLEECIQENLQMNLKTNELNEKINELESENQELTEKLRRAQLDCMELKNKYEQGQFESMNNGTQTELDCEILKLKQELEESRLNYEQLTQKLENSQQSFESLRIKNEELLHEKTQTKDIERLHFEIEEHKQMLDAIKKEKLVLQETLEKFAIEKDGFIKALELKHAESMQYYEEIQRLQAFIKNEQTSLKVCEKCVTLEANLTELLKDHEKFQDQIVFLKEKSDILTSNLLTEQTNQRLTQEDNQKISEQNLQLQKEVSRLRDHLLEVEEQHTKEAMEMQQQLEIYKSKLNSLESEVSKSSTAYTSANIRANQHAETLLAQYSLLAQQRDELLVKLSLAEDQETKNKTALVNLQCALEQFQNDKENDIKEATVRLRKKLREEEEKQQKLKGEIEKLTQHLTEANSGLRAASRLSDQLDTSQQTIDALREELVDMQAGMATLKTQLAQSESSNADKIEKSLIKSLIIGYFATQNNNDKQQVLRMIASVLEFTQAEIVKIGLTKQHISWLGSILGQNNHDEHTKGRENLVQAFVQFLEKESQPQVETMPNLLNITNSTRDQQTTGNQQFSPTTPLPVQPFILEPNILNEFQPSRNSTSILKDILKDT